MSIGRGILAATAFALALLARPIAAADCTGAPADCVETTITVDGIARIYQYHVPQSVACSTTNLPLVLFLHGGGGTANQVRASVGYETGEKNCYVEVFPQGIHYSEGALWTPGECIGLPAQSGYTGATTPPGCGYGLEQAGVSDVRYIGAVLDDLKHRVSYDARRVYAMGWSHGGGMTHRLACEMSDRITAIAPIEGTIKIAQCNPARAVPVIEWGSLGDTTSPFSGGSGDSSVPYSVSVHLVVSQLPPYASPTSTFVVPSVLNGAVTDTVKQWVGGKDESSVILHTLSAQLPHNWLFLDPVAFDWREINWTFFKQYSLPLQASKHRAVRK